MFQEKRRQASALQKRRGGHLPSSFIFITGKDADESRLTSGMPALLVQVEVVLQLHPHGHGPSIFGRGDEANLVRRCDGAFSQSVRQAGDRTDVRNSSAGAEY